MLGRFFPALLNIFPAENLIDSAQSNQGKNSLGKEKIRPENSKDEIVRE
jgi:hypothetical protein